MKFVFDLDGTLSFDYMTIDEEIQQVLLKAEDYGHELVFASARSYRDCLGLFRFRTQSALGHRVEWRRSLSSGAGYLRKESRC